jgi:hypothetical protein
MAGVQAQYSGLSQPSWDPEKFISGSWDPEDIDPEEQVAPAPTPAPAAMPAPARNGFLQIPIMGAYQRGSCDMVMIRSTSRKIRVSTTTRCSTMQIQPSVMPTGMLVQVL